MRFPSLVTLSRRAEEVLRRFPWTLGVGVFTAAAAIVATTHHVNDEWARLAMVGALGLFVSTLTEVPVAAMAATPAV